MFLRIREKEKDVRILESENEYNPRIMGKEKEARSTEKENAINIMTEEKENNARLMEKENSTRPMEQEKDTMILEKGNGRIPVAEFDTGIVNNENKRTTNMLKCIFDCDKIWQISNIKQTKRLLKAHIMFHLKEQFLIQQRLYFKDDKCIFCDKAIKFQTDQRKHLYGKHNVLRGEIEQYVEKNLKQILAEPNIDEEEGETSDIQEQLLAEEGENPVNEDGNYKQRQTELDFQNQLLLDQDLSDDDDDDDTDDGKNEAETMDCKETDEALIQIKLLRDQDISDDDDD